jgi:hypothetical protein
MLVQSWISHIMVPLFASRRIAYIRTVLSALGVVAFFMSLVFGILAANTFHRYHPDEPTPRPWSRRKHKEGYDLHCISAFAEWGLAIFHMLFILTFSRDFEKIRCELTVVPLVGHLDQSPVWSSQDSLEA